MERNSAPDAAFACVFEHGGIQYKLGRHHNLDTVQDGNEHDTVNPSLLAFALRTVDQLPISEEERNKVRKHLQEHQIALSKDVNRLEMEEDRAERIVQQQVGGKDGNETLTSPKYDVEHEPKESNVVRKEDGLSVAELAQKNIGGSITGGGSTPTDKGEKNTDAGSPDGDQQNTLLQEPKGDVENKDGTGTPGSKPKVSEGPIDSDRPFVETDGGEMVETNPAVNDSATVPTSKNKLKKSNEGLHLPEQDLKKRPKDKRNKMTEKDKGNSNIEEEDKNLEPDNVKKK